MLAHPNNCLVASFVEGYPNLLTINNINDLKVRDREAEQKEKDKKISDKRRRSVESEIYTGA